MRSRHRALSRVLGLALLALTAKTLRAGPPTPALNVDSAFVQAVCGDARHPSLLLHGIQARPVALTPFDVFPAGGEVFVDGAGIRDHDANHTLSDLRGVSGAMEGHQQFLSFICHCDSEMPYCKGLATAGGEANTFSVLATDTMRSPPPPTAWHEAESDHRRTTPPTAGGVSRRLLGSAGDAGVHGVAPLFAPLWLKCTKPIYQVPVTLETDSAFLRTFQGDLKSQVKQAVDYVHLLIAFANKIAYEGELQISLFISELYIQTTKEGAPGSSRDIRRHLGHFRAFRERMRPGHNLSPGIVHLLSGYQVKEEPGRVDGVSSGAGACAGGIGLTRGLGYYGHFHPAHNRYTWDMQGLMHELAHSMGGVHTHELRPPVDCCAPPGDPQACPTIGLPGLGSSTPGGPGGCSPGQPCGTLMSYCNLDSWENKAYTFGGVVGTNIEFPYGYKPKRIADRMRNHVRDAMAIDGCKIQKITRYDGDLGCSREEGKLVSSGVHRHRWPPGGMKVTLGSTVASHPASAELKDSTGLDSALPKLFIPP